MNDSTKRNYWFKRRRYGYGWTPVTWRGWVTIVVFLVVVVAGAAIILKDTPRNTFSSEVYTFLAFVAVATALIFAVSLAKGPKPKWRWGSRPGDDPREDT